MLPRSVQALRRPLAAASSSRAALPAIRRLATSTDAAAPNVTTSSEEFVFEGPPPPKVISESYLKTYTGKGYPMIPGLRHVIHPYHPHLFNGGPVRELTIPLRRKGGRGNKGQLVNRGIGGGHKQRLRTVDFYRLEGGIHDVVRIEYDPGRSGHIALLHRRGAGLRSTPDQGAVLAETTSTSEGGTTELRIKRNEVKGGWSYILAPDSLRAGDVVQSFRGGVPEGFVEGWTNNAENAADIHSTATRALGTLRRTTVKPGNVLPLYLIPPGTVVHNLTTNPDGRMALCRSAGTFATVVAHHDLKGEAIGGPQVMGMGGVMINGQRTKKNGNVLVKLQSGEIRKLEPGCIATIGMVSNKEHQLRSIGKAGRSRWLGKRPKVRGVAMNACDHPHGGGRGKSKGNKHPRSAKGLLQGVRTRRPKDKDGNKMVINERRRGKKTAAAPRK